MSDARNEDDDTMHVDIYGNLHDSDADEPDENGYMHDGNAHEYDNDGYEDDDNMYERDYACDDNAYDKGLFFFIKTGLLCLTIKAPGSDDNPWAEVQSQLPERMCPSFKF